MMSAGICKEEWEKAMWQAFFRNNVDSVQFCIDLSRHLPLLPGSPRLFSFLAFLARAGSLTASGNFFCLI